METVAGQKNEASLRLKDIAGDMKNSKKLWIGVSH
jgi:hypothetical protein